MTLVAIYYQNPWTPVVQNTQSKEKFIQCCEALPTDWAHLIDQKTGEILHTWRKENDCKRN